MLDTPLAKAIYQGMMEGFGLLYMTKERHGVTKTSSVIRQHKVKPVKVTSTKVTGVISVKYNGHGKFFAKVGDKMLANTRRRDLIRTLEKHGFSYQILCGDIKDKR